MKTPIFLGLLLTFFASPILAQEVNPPFRFDGTAWKALEEKRKTLYVFGFLSGADYFTRLLSASCSSQSMATLTEMASLTPIIPGTLIETVSYLYADPANAAILWNDMIFIAIVKLNGHSIEQILADPRKSSKKWTAERPPRIDC